MFKQNTLTQTIQRREARENLIAMYLDWWNDYISYEVYAEHNGLTVEQAKALLKVAKEVHRSPHPDA